jgi:alkaline phosphatase
MNIDVSKTQKILGIFAGSHLEYEIMRNENEPSLLEMTSKALELLQQNEKGYVLLVEGGRIDHAHHDTIAQRALTETAGFARTIEYVKSNTNEEDTLIIVTADHGHVMTVGGYAVSFNI